MTQSGKGHLEVSELRCGVGGSVGAPSAWRLDGGIGEAPSVAWTGRALATGRWWGRQDKVAFGGEMTAAGRRSRALAAFAGNKAGTEDSKIDRDDKEEELFEKPASAVSIPWGAAPVRPWGRGLVGELSTMEGGAAGK
jgi:hypothetical protein